jgi:hypothetical protein
MNIYIYIYIYSACIRLCFNLFMNINSCWITNIGLGLMAW